MTNSTQGQTPRKISEDEWYAAQVRNDPSELRALVEQSVAHATQSPLATRCLLREANSGEHGLVYMPDTQARAPGHVYSPNGMIEARRSHWCEWCFDKMTSDPASLEEKKGQS